MSKVVHLSNLHEKFFERGFRVIGVSDEPADKLREEVVRARGAKYWIASDPEDKTQGAFITEGRLAIPKFYLIDARGTVVASDGVPSEHEIEELLDSAFDPRLGRELHAELELAERLYRRGAWGAAFERAGRFLSDEDPAVAADAKLLRGKVEAYARHWRELSEFKIAKEDPNEAYGHVLLLRHRFAGLDRELLRWTEEQLERLEEFRRVKDHRKAWRKFVDALERDLLDARKREPSRRTIRLYEQVVKKHPWTPAGRLAADRLQELRAE